MLGELHGTSRQPSSCSRHRGAGVKGCGKVDVIRMPAGEQSLVSVAYAWNRLAGAVSLQLHKNVGTSCLCYSWYCAFGN